MADLTTTPAEFMAGVRLLDEMLRDAESLGQADEAVAATVWLEAELRGAEPLNLYLLPAIKRLIAQPHLAEGFAAALGDYIGMLQQGLAPSNGDQFTHLKFTDIVAQGPGGMTSKSQPQ